MTRTYIAGPMRGIEAFNFPAFHAEEARLAALGQMPVNPARMDEEIDGFDPTDGDPKDMRHYMARDLPALLTCDRVSVLPGWTDSLGAMLEACVASAVGIPIFDGENEVRLSHGALFGHLGKLIERGGK